MPPKKFICYILLAIILIAGCKKDKENLSLTATGTWKLISSNSNIVDHRTFVTYSTTTYPCIGSNKLTFNNDGTLTGGYTGKDTCFIYKNSAKNFFAIGLPTDPQDTGSWAQNGNNLEMTVKLGYANYTQMRYATLSRVNGQTQLIRKDTLNLGPPTFNPGYTIYSTDTYIKE